MANSYSDILALNDECQRIVADSRAKVDEKKTDIGWLGVIFGAGKYSGYNVASVTIILCLAVGLFCICWKVIVEQDVTYDAWNHLSSIVTLALGYLFGAKVAK